MHILLTGGTGFIGQALSAELVNLGYRLTILTRQSLANSESIHYCYSLTEFSSLDGFDAVINLAGEPIFDKAWTATQKQRLIDSRIHITDQLVQLFLQSKQPPKVFLSGSATGIYGDLTHVKIGTELSACGKGFAAQLCQQWEQAALKAQHLTRVCLLRTGMVLSPKGGALKRMLPLYRLGLGGKLGDGKQMWGVISLEDEIRAILFLLHQPSAQGPYNLVNPAPISNAEFNQQLGKVLHRPVCFTAPAFGLKLLLGERARLLLDNQPLIPQKLLAEGFQFQQTTLQQLLLSEKSQ